MKQFKWIGAWVFLFAWIASASAGEPYAKIVGGGGDLRFKGETVKVGTSIEDEGEFESGADGTALISFLGKKATLTVAKNSKVTLKPPKIAKEQGYSFSAGICRWKIDPKENKKAWVKVATRSAVMGVRGTDFLAVFNPLLGESEIVVFDGKVHFQSANNPKDSKEVPPKHWGGIGGRFGQKIGNLIQLSDSVLNELKKPVEVSASISE